MRKLLACFIGVVFSVVSYASETLCQPKENIIFSCPIKSSPKIISVCGSSNLTADKGYLQYRFGTVTNIEFTFPKSKDKTQNQFWWEEHRAYESFDSNLSFRNSGYVYTIFSYEFSEELNANKYGVNIFKTNDEKWKRTFECAQKPTGHFSLSEIVPE